MSKKNTEDIEKITDAAPEKDGKKKKVKGKKLKYGSMSVAMIVVVIAIVVLANLMCGLLMQRYPVKLDLTADKRYDLTDETIGVLKDIDKDVEITVTTPRDTFASLGNQYKSLFYQYYGTIVDVPYEIIPEILDKYSVYAEAGKGGIDVKFVDINKDPDVIARYSQNYNGEITEQSIIFSCGDRVKVLSQNDVLGMITPSQTSTQNNIQMVFNGESAITSAIMSVTDSHPVRVAVAVSMNSNSIFDSTHASLVSSFESFLSKNGYDCTEIDIATDELSVSDYDMVVVAAPAVDFSDDIIAKLSDFLYNGGNYEKNMIYIPNFYATNLPNISEFLEDWKIQIDPYAILDENMTQVRISALGTVDYAPMLEVIDYESVGTLPNESLPIAAPGTRPITILSKNNESVIKEVLKSSSTSYLTALLQDDTPSDEKTSYNAVVKSTKETSSGVNVYGSDLLVIGSPFMVDSSVLSNTNTYNNANVLLNTINNMTGKEEGVIIPEKALQQNNIALDIVSARVIQFVVIIIIPALIALVGVIVLLRRKNR